MPPASQVGYTKADLPVMHHTCAAPEELVMPKDTPRAPFPFLASLLAPLVWAWGRPDLFDTYSAGIILMQVFIMVTSRDQGMRGISSQGWM